MGNELSLYLQKNIQLFGNAIRECLEYFQNDAILSLDEMKPYTPEKAKKKIEMIKEIIS